MVRLFRPCLEKNLKATVRASSCLSPSANMMPFLCRNKRMQPIPFHPGRPILITPEGQFSEKGNPPTPKVNETEGFQCLGHSNWTICNPQSHFCFQIFTTFSLSYSEANSFLHSGHIPPIPRIVGLSDRLPTAALTSSSSRSPAFISITSKDDDRSRTESEWSEWVAGLAAALVSFCLFRTGE